MKEQEKQCSSLRDSFRYALHGVKSVFQEERNIRIHLVAALSVCILAFALRFTLLKWSILVLTIGFVITAEALNTAVEKLVDLIQPEQHPLAKQAKDIAAGAVLIAAVISVIIGSLLFVPPLWILVTSHLE